MTQKAKKIRYLSSYAVANRLAFKVPPFAPPDDAPKEVKEAAQRGLKTFYQSVSRGTSPRADAKRGVTNLWDEEKFERYLESLETKKADVRANEHQPKNTTDKPAKESRGKRNLPQRKRDVNAEVEAVRHAE